MRHLTTAAVAIAAGAAILLMSIAPAGAVSGADPTGDAISPKGDIVGYGFRHSDATSRYVAKVVTRRSVNPVTANSWHSTNTAIHFFWDTTPLPGDEFETNVTVTGEGSGPFVLQAATVQATTGLPSGLDCTATTGTGSGATVKYVRARHMYKVRVPDTCLPLAQSVSAHAEMVWDPHPSGGTDMDRAPDSGSVAIP